MRMLWCFGAYHAKRSGWRAMLLMQVNLLLSLFGGICLVSAIRHRWDPSTYFLPRMFFPEETRVGVVTFGVVGVLLALLAQLAAIAQHASTHRITRMLLYIYAVAMSVLVMLELVFAVWLVRRVMAWLLSSTAVRLLEAREFMNWVKPIRRWAASLFTVTQQLDDLFENAQNDAPIIVYIMVFAGLLLVLLQVLGVVLALLLARSRQLNHVYSVARGDCEKGSLPAGFEKRRVVKFSPRATAPLPPPPVPVKKENRLR